MSSTSFWLESPEAACDSEVWLASKGRATHDVVFEGLLREIAHVTLPATHTPELPSGTALCDGRFTLLRLLGRGATGVVYEAHDARRDEPVALKLLARVTSESVYRLKHEFRRLVDLEHRNLVRLYELFADAERWFFTMELVSGVAFDAYVRPHGQLVQTRLRAAFPQLIHAVTAIHAAGTLHRDLKPSNVLVCETGRVVVLDFGLSADVEPGGIGHTLGAHRICGTPAYMAPEQAAARPASAASDFYALGVMLFEALTGRAPFEGSSGEIIAAKLRDDPPPLSNVPHELADLSSLCGALLARAPDARPTGATLGLRFGVTPASEPSDKPWLGHSLLHGRAQEMHTLHEAFAGTLSARAPIVVQVRGEAGVGKSALCSAFVHELQKRGAVMVLAGRSHERESVPFQAFDMLVDALSHALCSVAQAEQGGLVPRDVVALATLFPSLRRIPAFATALAAAHDADVAADPRELRQRAFLAFGELLSGLRARGPMVLWLDDLQWADAESRILLAELLQSGCNFGLLLLSHRAISDDDGALQGVFACSRARRQLALHRLCLGPLDELSVRSLIETLLPTSCSSPAEVLAVVAGAAAGNPLLVHELTRFIAQQPEQPARSWSELMALRLDRLEAPALRVLWVLALAGEPLSVRTSLAAAEATSGDIDRLREQRLVRVARGRPTARAEHIECIHDRIREAISQLMTPATRKLMVANLAAALVDNADEAPELLCRSLAEAGDEAAALRFACLAAERANAALAFDRAAALYSEALAWVASDSERLWLNERCASALEYAGRGREAGAVYKAAAELANGPQKLDLTRKAARQLLLTGQFAEGMVLLEDVAHAVGVPFPSTKTRALKQRIDAELALLLRGRSKRGHLVVNPELAQKLDVAEGVVVGFGNYHPFHAQCAAMSYLALARRAGDAHHIATALGLAANAHSWQSPDSMRSEQLVHELEQLIGHTHSASPRALGFLHFVKGTVGCNARHYEQARLHYARAERMLREHHGNEGMLDAVQFGLQLCAAALGDCAAIAVDTPRALENALRRGRIWLAAMLCGPQGMLAWLTPDQPDVAWERVREVRRHWVVSPERQRIDFELLTAEVSLALYEQQPERALAQLDAAAPSFRGSRQWQIRGARAPNFQLWRAYCQAACLRRAPRGSERHANLRTAIARTAQTMRRHWGRWSVLALGLQASLDLDAGNTERAADTLVRLLENKQCAPRGAHAAALRLRLGELFGGEEGRALVEKSRAAMVAQGVSNSERMRQYLFPGLSVD